MTKIDHRLLILGSAGRLGRLLTERYPQARQADRTEIDLMDRRALENYDWDSIDTIINAAAYTNVNGSETPEGRRLAWQINAEVPAALARIATLRALTLVHFSSDYVFDGSITPHTEDEPFAPLGVYGQTKAAGDVDVSTTKQHYLLRTSWLVAGVPNFVTTMVQAARTGQNPKVVTDQIGRLTFGKTLIAALDHLVKTESPYGTYHVSNSGPPASFADIARRIFEICGRNPDDVIGITTAEQQAEDPAALAPRPLNSTFELTKIESAGFTPPDWQEQLAAYLKSHKSS